MSNDKMLGEIGGMLNNLFGSETAKDIMDANFGEDESLPGGKRTYLTVEEFISEAPKSNDIIILTKKDNRYRCHCKTPVRDLKFNIQKKTLSWSDANGDPDLNDVLKETEMRDIEYSGGRWSVSAFRVTKRKK